MFGKKKTWNPHTLLLESKMVKLLWKTSFLKCLNIYIHLPYDPAIPFLDIYPREKYRSIERLYAVFTVVLFLVTKTWKLFNCPSAYEYTVVYQITEYYSVRKRIDTSDSIGESQNNYTEWKSSTNECILYGSNYIKP